MRSLVIGALLLVLIGVIKLVPKPPKMEPEVAAPDQVLDFDALYSQNCSGCHGKNGKGGPAPSLGDPAYLALADDATIRRVATNGVPGTAMSGFAQSAGGMLTDKQIDVLVSGIRSRWANPHAVEGPNPPPYSAQGIGDASRGAQAYATYCSSCHGPNGKGGQKASSIVDGAYLALVSDQGLRTSIIVGRPELGFPDWRNDVPGKPMSAQDVSDVVAWMAAQRPKYPGQPYSSSPKAGESE
jgi:mono/diheme cytochrome c family protein